MSQIDYMVMYRANRNQPADGKVMVESTDSSYRLYELGLEKLEARIKEMNSLPDPPRSLLDGLLFLGVNVTSNKPS
jgi:hypothetical protein